MESGFLLCRIRQNAEQLRSSFKYPSMCTNTGTNILTSSYWIFLPRHDIMMKKKVFFRNEEDGVIQYEFS